MSERQTCVDCHELSPETETNYTLISSRFGWRLTQRKDAKGTVFVEWRCPVCWRAYKAARGDVGTATRSSDKNAAHPASGTQRTMLTAAVDDDPTLRDDHPPPVESRPVTPKGTRKR
jgi:hypothetical protein